MTAAAWLENGLTDMIIVGDGRAGCVLARDCRKTTVVAFCCLKPAITYNRRRNLLAWPDAPSLVVLHPCYLWQPLAPIGGGKSYEYRKHRCGNPFW